MFLESLAQIRGIVLDSEDYWFPKLSPSRTSVNVLLVGTKMRPRFLVVEARQDFTRRQPSATTTDVILIGISPFDELSHDFTASYASPSGATNNVPPSWPTDSDQDAEDANSTNDTPKSDAPEGRIPSYVTNAYVIPLDRRLTLLWRSFFD